MSFLVFTVSDGPGYIFRGHRLFVSEYIVPGVGVLWYFHTYVDSAHLLGFKILNFNIFGGFRKNKYFLGYERSC